MSLLDKLNKKKQAKLLDRIRAELELADDHFQSVIMPQIITRQKIYRAALDLYQDMFPRLSKQSKARSFDVRNVVEWIMPAFMKAFFSENDSVVSIAAESDEDWQKAIKTKKLLGHQILVENKGFSVFEKWIEEALVLNLGVIKCYWERTAKALDRELYIDINNLEELRADPNVEIKEIIPTDSEDIVRVIYVRREFLKNQPILENVPVSELRWTPWAKSLGEDCPMIAHHVPVTVDMLKRRERAGVYRNIDKALKNAEDASFNELDLLQNPSLQDVQYYEDGNRMVHIDEVYMFSDIDGDGVMEPIVATVCGNTLIRLDENPNKRHPFFWLSTYRDPYKVFGEDSLAEIIGEFQHFKTAMFRQISVNLSINNSPRKFVNGNAINIDDLIKDKEWVRVTGNPREAVYPMPTQPLAPWTMTFLEVLERHIEQLSGRSRVMRGMIEGAKADTAHGMQLLFDAGNAKLNSIVRKFAECDGGVIDMLRYMIKLNSLYMDQKKVVRLINDTLDVSMDDLDGKYDLVVNSGVGVSDKEMQTQALQLYVAKIFPQALELGVADARHYVKAGKALLKLAGLEDSDSYFVNEEEVMPIGAIPNNAGGTPSALPNSKGLESLPPEIAGALGGGADPLPKEIRMQPRRGL